MKSVNIDVLLLPCPFCGAAADEENGFSPVESVYYVWCTNLDCKLCDVDIGFDRSEWNNRAFLKRISQKWIKCSDRLPDNGTVVLINVIKDGIEYVSHESSLFANGFRLWRENDFGAFDWFITDTEVTHWQSLPDSPIKDPIL